MPRRRRHPDQPTRPRRIHATDGEWQDVADRAEAQSISVSRYVVEAALERVVRREGPGVIETIHVLHLAGEDLGRIADAVEAQDDIGSVLQGLSRLASIEERLDWARDLMTGARRRTTGPGRGASR